MLNKAYRFLRFLKSRQATLSASYLIYTFSQGYSGVVQVGLLILLTTLLPTDEFGLVALLMVSIPLVGRVATLGADIGLSIRIWKCSNEDQARYLSALLSWFSATVLAMMLILIAVHSVWEVRLDFVITAGVLLAVALRTIVELFQVMMRREGRVARVGFFIVFRASLYGAGVVLAIHYLGRSASAFLAGVIAAETVAACWAMFQLSGLYRLRFFARGSLASMRGLVRIGFPSIPGTAAFLLLAAGDRFVISSLNGLAATGIYALGQRLAESLVQILFVPFASAFGPHALNLAAKDRAEAFALISRTAALLAYLGAVVLGVPAIAAREFILSLSGAQYEPTVGVFMLILAAVLTFQVTQTLSVYFSHMERLRQHMWIMIVGAVANVLLNVVAVKALGILGAAIVSLFVYQVMQIAVAYIVRRSGSMLVSLGRIQIAMGLFLAYLAVIYLIDASSLGVLTAISLKSLAWIAFAGISLAVSKELRWFLAGQADRLRSLLGRAPQ